MLHGQGVYHDLRATPLGGGVYEVTAIETGQPFVIEDPSGRVVLRDRGAVRGTYVFDTLGDGQPGGDVLAVTDVVVHGPHPSLDDAFCEIATALTS